MMWGVWFLLCAALSVDSYSVRDTKERLAHGRQLKIYLSRSAEKMDFSPASAPDTVLHYWSSSTHRLRKGRVSGTGDDRRWYLDHVTYEDEGTYILRDYWNKDVSVVKVMVIAKNTYIQREPGMTLTIPLEGIGQDDAQLTFRGDFNATLVKDGAPVGREHPDFYGRVSIFSTRIEIARVNTSDLGVYSLSDRNGRLVSTTRLELTDHLDQMSGNPLMALLLLLGIPAGICCCCRKKIFRKKGAAAATTTTTTTTETVHPPPGPPPGYNAPMGGVSPGGGAPVFYNTGPTQDPNMGYPPPNPGMPGPQWNGPPPTNPNPLYPPIVAPVQPPQWNGPPPAQYNPGAAMGYAPVMYSAPPPAGEPVKMENMSPADPLLAHPPPMETASSPLTPPAPVPDASDAYKFQVDVGKSTTNFL